MSSPCERCGADLPLGVDLRTRRVRTQHFMHDCPKRAVPEPRPNPFDEEREACAQACEALDPEIYDEDTIEACARLIRERKARP